jgi:hypothetical protein
MNSVQSGPYVFVMSWRLSKGMTYDSSEEAHTATVQATV